MRWRTALALFALPPITAGCDLASDSKLGDPAGLSATNLPEAPILDAGPVEGGLCNGAAPIDAGPCDVKFSTDLWPLMAATGTWGCADGNCHGGTAQNPFINSAASAYSNLAAYKIGGKPYINPCSTDVDAASFACNLEGTCGTQAMPVPDSTKGRSPATPADIARVVTWLQCGSPNN